MAETTDQIATHLETKQDDLRANLEELEDKVKSVTDWRHQFRNNPALMLGLAFGGGLLLAGVMRPRRRAEPRLSNAPLRAREPRRPEGRRTQLRQIREDIQGALIAAATSRITAALTGAVPAFRDRSGARGAAAKGNGVQGEGDYEAARRYQADVGRYVRSANIERAARAAAPGPRTRRASWQRRKRRGASVPSPRDRLEP